MRLSAYIVSSIKENKGKYIVCVIGIMIAIGTFFSLMLFSAQFTDTFDSFYGNYDRTLFVVDENSELSNLVPVTSRINESYAEEIDDFPGVVGTVNVIFAELSNFTTTQFVLDKIFAFEQKDFNFYQGKMSTLRYFYGYELPKTLGLVKRLMHTDGLTAEMQTEFFND